MSLVQPSRRRNCLFLRHGMQYSTIGTCYRGAVPRGGLADVHSGMDPFPIAHLLVCLHARLGDWAFRTLVRRFLSLACFSQERACVSKERIGTCRKSTRRSSVESQRKHFAVQFFFGRLANAAKTLELRGVGQANWRMVNARASRPKLI